MQMETQDTSISAVFSLKEKGICSVKSYSQILMEIVKDAWVDLALLVASQDLDA